MKYLLIDFGASFIKTIVYDSSKKIFYNSKNYESPLKKHTTISAQDLLETLMNIVKNNIGIDGIVICSVLGGFYNNGIYHSWKSELKGIKNYCMISGLFKNEKTFHIHEHHAKFLGLTEFNSKLSVLGSICGVNVYSALGDTDCVIKSIDIGDTDILINMGTGSQVITNKERISHIPSGRSFMIFYYFFENMGIDMFDMMKSIKVEDIFKSNLKINLNMFPESFKYVEGGSISGINEYNFTLKNILSSILKEYVDQYSEFISDHKQIILTGGIPKKLKVIEQYFTKKYPNKNIMMDNISVENTHRGIAKFIEEFL